MSLVTKRKSHFVYEIAFCYLNTAQERLVVGKLSCLFYVFVQDNGNLRTFLNKFVDVRAASVCRKPRQCK